MVSSFPGYSGRHITLKFYNAESTGEFVLNYMRLVMVKTGDRNDNETKFPNMDGKHLTLKITHSADATCNLNYASIGLLMKRE